MNKAELIDVLTKKMGTDRRQATAAVENVVDTIVRAVHKGDSVTITGSVFSSSAVARPGWRVTRAPAKRSRSSRHLSRRSGPGAQFKAVVSGAQRLPSEGPAVKRGCGRRRCRKAGEEEGREEGRASKRRRQEGREAAAAKKAVQASRSQEGREARRRQEGRARSTAPRRPSKKTRRQEGRAKKAPAKKAAAKKTAAKKAAAKTAAKQGSREARRQEGRRPSAAAGSSATSDRRGSSRPAAVRASRLSAASFAAAAGWRCGRRRSASRRAATAPTCCPCGCATCPGRTPSRSHHHCDQVRNHLALSANHRRAVRPRRSPARAAGPALRSCGSTPLRSASARRRCRRRVRRRAVRPSGRTAAGRRRTATSAPNASSWPTSDSAWARPCLSSGRFRSSPLYRFLRPAVPWRTISTVFVSAGSLVNRRNTFRSCG